MIILSFRLYRPADFRWRDCYLPRYEGPDINASVKRREAEKEA